MNDKNEFRKKVTYIGSVTFLVVAAGILFYHFVFNNTEFITIGKNFINLMKPIIIGAFVAYLLNPVMSFIELKIAKPVYDKVRNKKKTYNKSIPRVISLLFTLVFVGLLMYLLIMLVVPQVIESVQTIIIKLPDYFNNVNNWVNELLHNNEDILAYINAYTVDVQQWFTTTILPKLQESITTVSSGLIGGVVSFVKALLNFIIGVIVSTYLLKNKELFAGQAKKIAYAFFDEERANNIINNIRFADKTFGGFLTGKIFDSFIIGVLCFIVLAIFKIPYPVLISVIVGVTNIIPYFGPFLGAIPSGLILLMVDPVKALTFIIIIVVLQQVDGSIIGPKILGDSTGLSSFWVIFSITLFGGYFGVFGMFIGVPVFAVIYAAIKTFVNERLEKKQYPTSTSFYINSDYISDDVNVNAGNKIKFVKKTFDNVYVEGKKVVRVTTEEDEDKNYCNIGKNDTN